MVTAEVPTSARAQRLRTGLQSLHKASGLTAKEVGQRMNRSEAAFYRWMTPKGVAGLSWERVLALCKIWGADEATTDQMVALAQDSENLLGWLETYGGAPTGYLRTYLGFEAVAVRISMYDNAVLHGLFQSKAYARAVIAAGLPSWPDEEVDRRVNIRVERQTSVLDRAEPPQVWAVVTEGVLRQRIIDREAMRTQLRQLLDLSGRKNITLQVHGFECAATPATGGSSITMFKMPEPTEPPVLYLELPDSGLFIEDDEVVARHADILEHARAAALSPAESRARIAAIARDL